MENKFINSDGFGKFAIVALWFLTTLFYWHFFGLNTSLEAQKYIKEANYFINNGSLSETRYWFYSCTIFIIVISLKLGLGLYGAFLFQGIINLVAYLFFFKALKSIFTSNLIALGVILYLIIFWPYQSWVVYLYTESIFYSAILILTSTLILYKPTSAKRILFLLVATFFTIMSRPLGILFALGVYAYIFFHTPRKQKIIIAFGSTIIALLGYIIINKIFSTIPDWYITKPFEEESIICDWPLISSPPKLDLDKTGSPIYQLYYYITHNFSHCMHFVGIKLKYFFLMDRTYYSKIHNYFLLLNVVPMYLFALCSFFIKQKNTDRGFLIFLVTGILFYTLSISLQCDDYHNRFILSIYPFFVILAAKTIDHWAIHFSYPKNSKA